jgi:hypothetical protein
VIARLSGEWQAEYEHWQRRDLSARRYVYLWADGVYLQARMEEHAEFMLVMIGATPVPVSSETMPLSSETTPSSPVDRQKRRGRKR